MLFRFRWTQGRILGILDDQHHRFANLRNIPFGDPWLELFVELEVAFIIIRIQLRPCAIFTIHWPSAIVTVMIYPMYR